MPTRRCRSSSTPGVVSRSRAPTCCCASSRPNRLRCWNARVRWPANSTSSCAWEFAPEAEFGFADLARDYFDKNAGAVHQAAMLFGLFDAPHYFRRVGKGVFRKASRETVQAALAAIERKRVQAAQVSAWADDLIGGQCAAPIREQLYRILFKPDKNSPEYKAVVEASRRAQRAPLDLLRAAGAIDSPYQFHLAALLVRAVSARHRLRRSGRARHERRTAAGRRAGVLDRRQLDHRDRRRAVGARSRHWHCRAGDPHRGAGACDRSPTPRSTVRPANACPPSTCRATRSPCCPMPRCSASR